MTFLAGSLVDFLRVLVSTSTRNLVRLRPRIPNANQLMVKWSRTPARSRHRRLNPPTKLMRNRFRGTNPACYYGSLQLTSYRSLRKPFSQRVFEKKLSDCYIKVASKLQTRLLCDEMQATLPYELRTMIYAELLGPDTHYDHSTTSHYLTNIGDADNFHEILEHHPHVRDPAYLGPETYEELAETWYKLALFRLSKFSNVEDLFSRDIWGLGLDLRKYLRNVQVTIRPSNSNPETYPPGPKDVLMAKSLEALTQLEKGCRITVAFDFRPWARFDPTPDEARLWFKEVAVIFPTLERLMVKEMRIKIKIDDAEAITLTKEWLDVEYWMGLFMTLSIAEDA
jgi:hypothetical protein